MKSELIKWSFLKVLWISVLLKVKVAQLCLTLVTPWTTQSMEFSRPEYWVGSLSLFQGIFPTQGLNPGLPHCRWILYQLRNKGSPSVLLEATKYPFYMWGSSLHSRPPWWLRDKESAFQCRRCRFDPRVGKIPWRREWQPSPVCLSGESHAWWAIVHRVTKSWIWLKWLTIWQSSFLIPHSGTESKISNKLRDDNNGTSKQEGWSKGDWALCASCCLHDVKPVSTACYPSLTPAKWLLAKTSILSTFFSCTSLYFWTSIVGSHQPLE